MHNGRVVSGSSFEAERPRCAKVRDAQSLDDARSVLVGGREPRVDENDRRTSLLVRDATPSKEATERITTAVDEFLVSSNARAVLLVDRAGLPVAEAGEMRGFSVSDFAALAVADFCASEQISTLLSNPFNSIFHEGVGRSLYLAGVEGELVLIVLFDQRVNAGMMRIKVKAAVGVLASLCKDVIGSIDRTGPDDENVDINWGIEELDFDWMADDLNEILSR